MKKISIYLRPEEEKIIEQVYKNPRGILLSELAKDMDVSNKTIAKRVDILVRAGLIDERIVQRAKLYYPKEVKNGIHKKKGF